MGHGKGQRPGNPEALPNRYLETRSASAAAATTSRYSLIGSQGSMGPPSYSSLYQMEALVSSEELPAYVLPS